jgi:hypothetical protein
VRYTQGTECWFIGDHNRWFRVRIVRVYGARNTFRRVVLEAITGFDAEHQVPWPYEDGLAVTAGTKAYKRLRPIDARDVRPNV